MSFPYIFYQCPCADDYWTGASETHEPLEDLNASTDTTTFDPRKTRSAFSLYPLEHLLWCEDCREIRCPRCTVQEIVCWYCPNCLFESASSMIKSEGNRCTRSCFNCPSCTAPLAVNALAAEGGVAIGPWILACDYCHWTSLDIGVQLSKPTNVYQQLMRQKATTPTSPTHVQSIAKEQSTVTSSDPECRFMTLKSFLGAQMVQTNPANPLASPGGNMNFESPSSLARLVNLYSGGAGLGKKHIARPKLMREALSREEGLQQVDFTADLEIISTLCNGGWSAASSPEQRAMQPRHQPLTDQLQPLPTLLRTKRSHRCAACRHILAKPDAKVTSIRYRIKLVASSHVPSISVKPLVDPLSGVKLDLKRLPAGTTLQFLMTLTNPMFEPVKVALATPAVTPGRFGTRITVLCPQFEIGANVDAWDEALEGDSRRTGLSSQSSNAHASGGSRVAEAGKVWERGRNWATVVLECVCPRIALSADELDEDEDVLEIPLSIHLDYESEAPADREDKAEIVAGQSRREKCELDFWATVALGRVQLAV